MGDLVGAGLIETVTSRLDPIYGLPDKPVGLTNSGGGLTNPATVQLDRLKPMALRADLRRGVAGPVIVTRPQPQRRGRGPFIVNRPHPSG